MEPSATVAESRLGEVLLQKTHPSDGALCNLRNRTAFAGVLGMLECLTEVPVSGDEGQRGGERHVAYNVRDEFERKVAEREVGEQFRRR